MDAENVKTVVETIEERTSTEIFGAVRRCVLLPFPPLMPRMGDFPVGQYDDVTDAFFHAI